METCMSLQVAYMFDPQRMDLIHKALGQNDMNGKGVAEFHIDIGRKEKQSTY